MSEAEIVKEKSVGWVNFKFVYNKIDNNCRVEAKIGVTKVLSITVPNPVDAKFTIKLPPFGDICDISIILGIIME